MDSDRLEVTRMAVAFIDEFQAAVASHVPALLSSQEALGEFLKKWTDTLLDRALACKPEDGDAYELFVVFLDELLKNQIDLALRGQARVGRTEQTSESCGSGERMDDKVIKAIQVIDEMDAFIDEFQKAVASHIPTLRSSQEALEEFLEEWADTLLDRVLACKSVGGNAYGVLVVLLNELLKNQIDLSVRAGRYGQVNY